MRADHRTIDILAYHSISAGPGPTRTTPAVFRQQMDALAACGYQVIPLADFVAWHEGKLQPAAPSVVLTFDDGFADFASEAFPELRSRGWTATVFLPAGKLGGTNDWEPPPAGWPPRRLLTCREVGQLAGEGVEFGGHGLTHAALTRLPREAARREIVRSKEIIEDCTGREVTSFAPPYGKTNAWLQAEIRTRFAVSVGTHLGRARRTSGLCALPRIEMYYFQDVRRWRAYLQARARLYFAVRRLLRRIRRLAEIG